MSSEPRPLPQNDRRPLYEQVKEALRADIAEGRYVRGEPFISQQKVCARFGVSAITAIRALNDLAAEGVLVRRHGRGTFVAEPVGSDDPPANSDRRAPRLRPAARAWDAPTIVCVAPGLHSLHIARLVSGVEAACAELGYHLTLTSSGNAAEREEAALATALQSRASGVVLYPAQGTIHTDIFEELRQAHLPVVMVDRYRPELATDAVAVDHFFLGRQLTECLIERGHRAILTLWGEIECSSFHERLAGHIQALRDHNLSVRSRLTLLRPHASLPEAERRAMLAELLCLPEPPTAVLSGDGYILATTAQDLITLGVDVPDQIELAAIDDAGAYGMLPLAAVAGILPSEDMGRQAVHLLARRMASDDPYRDPERLVLPVQIRTRESAVCYLRTARTGSA